MGKMRHRRGTAKWLAASVFITFFTVGAVFAQTQAMRVAIPYEFTFGKRVLPAGTYTFSVNGYEVIAKSSSSDWFRQNTIAQISGPSDILEAGALVFVTTGGGHILSEVWIPGTDGQLLYADRKVNTREFLLASYLDQARTVSGKAAYNQTCGRCHGADGNGNESADKFFGIAIPRLISATVQSKSDAELRELINKGSAVMPPVEIDVSGFRHRLPPQDVDAVIAYVRTLKK
jgi:mono/diheme cytochrome c family protein